MSTKLVAIIILLFSTIYRGFIHLNRRSASSKLLKMASSNNNNKRDRVTLEEVTVLSANYYESQILSALNNWKGERLASYLLPREFDYKKLSQMREEFNQNQSSFFSAIKLKNFEVGASVKCDLYFNPAFDSETDVDLSSFLSGAVLVLQKLSSIRDNGSIIGDWIFIEISQGQQFLLQKLWQLERAVHILPLIDPKFNPSNLVVLLNGEEKEADFAIANIRIPAHAKILEYPLFIGWTPTRNIFKLLGTLNDGMKNLEEDVKNLEEDMKNGLEKVETEIGDVKALLEQLLLEIRKK